MAFCSKCGTKLDEGIRFCTSCGSAVGGVSNTPITPAPLQQYVQAKLSAVQASGVYQKLKKNPAIIGGVVAAIVLVVVMLYWEFKPNYIATVNMHRPFVSQGYNTEYGVVFRKYIDSIKYAERKNGNVVYVDISGKDLSGENIVVTIRVTPDVNSNNVKIAPYSVTTGDVISSNQNEAVGTLLYWFYAYDEGFEQLYGND